MKAKITNGKWIIFPCVTKYETTIKTDAGVRIAEVKSYGKRNGFYDATQSERIANAKLIAAAPELLKACINSFKTFHSIGCTIEADIMQELEAAIKKATK